MSLYHYCSNEVFFSIVDRREIWLSSLNLSNDSMEGKLLSSVILQLASDDGLQADHLRLLREQVEYLEGYFDGLGFCLSERGDLLSQWRGYAADGAGVSIGFSHRYLESLGERYRAASARSTPASESGFFMSRVLYKSTEQRELLSNAYREIREKIQAGAFDYPRVNLLIPVSDKEPQDHGQVQKTALKELTLRVLTLFGTLFQFKSEAFEEEREWRLISMVIKSGDKFDVRPSFGKLIPFRKFNLQGLGMEPFEEIILGPKNVTPTHVVDTFLTSRGFMNVKVTRSAATYR